MLWSDTLRTDLFWKTAHWNPFANLINLRPELVIIFSKRRRRKVARNFYEIPANERSLAEKNPRRGMARKQQTISGVGKGKGCVEGLPGGRKARREFLNGTRDRGGKTDGRRRGEWDAGDWKRDEAVRREKGNYWGRYLERDYDGFCCICRFIQRIYCMEKTIKWSEKGRRKKRRNR